jgi:SAM-dependent methyltransferase
VAADFDVLLAEALDTPVEGWDFTRLGDRLTSTGVPWDYWAKVAELSAGVESMLDLGTGGGELLAAFAGRRPPLTVATESWPPNVPVAARRLRPLGIAVVRAEGAPDNDARTADDRRGRLPFRDGAFGLVIDRHEAFDAREVARVLAPGGAFLTQQVAWTYGDLNELLGVPWPGPSRVVPDLLEGQARSAGLRVEARGEAVVRQVFADAGALAWYLRQVPWAVDGFDVRRDADRLRAVHERVLATGPVSIRMGQFWFRAVKR